MDRAHETDKHTKKDTESGQWEKSQLTLLLQTSHLNTKREMTKKQTRHKLKMESDTRLYCQI